MNTGDDAIHGGVHEVTGAYVRRFNVTGRVQDENIHGENSSQSKKFLSDVVDFSAEMSGE